MIVDLRVLISYKSTKEHKKEERKEGRKIDRKIGRWKETKNGRREV